MARSAIAHVYPAYRSFQAMQRNQSAEVAEGEGRRWLTYWLVLGIFHSGEAIADPIIWWFPLYDEIKLLFILWLLFPSQSGANYLYLNWIRPYFITNGSSIESNLRGLTSALGPQLIAWFQSLPNTINALIITGNNGDDDNVGVSIVDFENVSKGGDISLPESPRKK